MALGYTLALRHAQLDEISTAVGNGGLLRIYDGTRATDADTAVGAQVKLAELVCGSPFAAAASGGDLTANAISDDTSTVAGTATWFRLTDSAGTTTVMDGDVATSGSDLNLNSVTITSGGTMSVTSFVITGGNA